MVCNYFASGEAFAWYIGACAIANNSGTECSQGCGFGHCCGAICTDNNSNPICLTDFP
jgi:hypothetical protein